MGLSPKIPFRFTQLSRSPSTCSLSPEGGQAHSWTPDDKMHYCVHIRVTLGERGGDPPPPSHAWSGSSIADIFQGYLKEWITKAVILAPGESIWWHKEGLPFGSARDARFSLTGSVNWARRPAQVEATVNTVQGLSQMLWWKRRWKPEDLGIPKGWGKLSNLQLVPAK